MEAAHGNARPSDPGELNQVWTNLIDNAVAAINDTGGAGTLTVRTAPDHRDQVLIEFQDTGPGVPPDIKGRIFDPFFTTKPVGQGTGLGLDISWRIVVNKHHGHIEVHSRPGETRFQVFLPLRHRPPTWTSRSPTTPRRPHDPARRNRPRRSAERRRVRGVRGGRRLVVPPAGRVPRDWTSALR